MAVVVSSRTPHAKEARTRMNANEMQRHIQALLNAFVRHEACKTDSDWMEFSKLSSLVLCSSHFFCCDTLLQIQGMTRGIDNWFD